MITKKNRSVNIKLLSKVDNRVLVNIECVDDNSNANGVSPYSNKTEEERMNDLNQSVREAKSALESFSYKRESLIDKLKRIVIA